MENSILTSTKKILGVGEDYTHFDLDILTHINSAFSTLDQLGVGVDGGFMVEGSENLWTELGIPRNQLNMVRTYIFLKVRALFDPPTTSFALEAMNNQIQEHEWRLSLYRENLIHLVVEIVDEEEPVW